MEEKKGNSKNGTFSWKELFSDVFNKHTDEELEKYWAAGTIGNIPSLDNVATGCPKPWAFVRIFGMSLVTYMIFLAAWNIFHNTNLLPGLIIVGTVAIPFSVVVLFFEMNVRRNVSIYLVLRMFIYGGAISLLFSLPMFHVGDMLKLGWLGASIAGPVEESGKLLAVIFVARNLRYPYILNGMLFGAAVGAGFASFESAGYALNNLIAEVIKVSAANGQEIITHLNGTGAVNAIFADIASKFDGPMLFNIVLRGFLSPFGHVIWTAATAGALWSVKGSSKFEWSMLGDLRFLKYFAVAVALHMMWNAQYNPQIVTPCDKAIVLGIIGWAMIIHLLRTGLKQLESEKSHYHETPQREPGVAEIISVQTAHAEKLVERTSVQREVPPREKSARERLDVESQVRESRERERNRERPDFSERAWKKYYQRDKED